jgi:hypothetical protein
MGVERVVFLKLLAEPVDIDPDGRILGYIEIAVLAEDFMGDLELFGHFARSGMAGKIIQQTDERIRPAKQVARLDFRDLRINPRLEVTGCGQVLPAGECSTLQSGS